MRLFTDDKCLVECGIPSNTENDKLKCTVRNGFVDCECKNWNMIFDSSDKTCKGMCFIL